MKLTPQEVKLVGSWTFVNGNVTADDVTRRIEHLTQHHLIEIGRDASGWDVLYRDPDDGRLWELTYPSSEMHGGGPPTLQLLDNEAVRHKYGMLKLS